MAVIDLFSKRQRRARGEMPDIYVYDNIPNSLRVQIVHIIKDALGEENSPELYQVVKNTLCREYGLFELMKYPKSDADSIFNFFLCEDSAERALDVVEICFKLISSYIPDCDGYKYSRERRIKPEDAVFELNQRLKEHGVGYQFESNEIIRVDSEFLHSESVKPALALLRGDGFKGANEEFLLAHEHYRHGRHKECLVESLKAFESTMKAICKLRGWTYQSGDSAKSLITTCLSNGLVPTYFDSQFSSFRSLLESGVPTVRNKNGGHGQGAEPVVAPAYLARYALNLTATTVLFLIEANTEKQ